MNVEMADETPIRIHIGGQNEMGRQRRGTTKDRSRDILQKPLLKGNRDFIEKDDGDFGL